MKSKGELEVSARTKRKETNMPYYPKMGKCRRNLI